MNAAANLAATAAAEIYTHKLFAPPAYAGVIRREAILERVFRTDAARVVLLQGPAGHGKSTSLQQIKSACEQQGFLTGWLTFDEADNDNRRLLIHVQALLASVRKNAGRQTAPEDDEIVDSGRRRQSDWVIDRLLKVGQPVALMLDDFQVLSNPTILAFFRELFERVPQNVRIFIGSRSTPEIGLSRLVVNRQALIVKPDDLRFSPSEVEMFFAVTENVTISPEEIRTIYQRTEGWPAALQLFRLSLMSPSVRRALGDLSASRPRELAEYLADNVLSLQPPAVQDFLLRTSLLTRLTAPLCDTVTGRPDSQDLLLQLEQSGLFLRSLDSEMRWFEYHALFASFLGEQLRHRSGEAVLEVHRRAARWHLAQGNYEETVHHAIACRDYALAGDTLDAWSAQLVAGAHLITMERWCERLPFAEIAKRPSLAIRFAWTLIFLHRRDKLKPVLELLQRGAPESDIRKTTDSHVVLSMAAIAADDAAASFRIVEHVGVREPDVSGFGAFELAAAANLMGYRQLALDDFEGARECLVLGRAHSERGDAAFSRGYTYALNGVSLLAQGRLREALDRFRAGMAEQRMLVDKSFASAALASCYVWALYEANELDLAEALFGQHHQVISDSALLDFLAVGYLAIARIHDVRGRSSQALDVLDEAEAIAHSHDWKRFSRILSWERVRRALLAGDLERAEAIAALIPAPETAAAGDWLLFSEDMEDERLGRIRLALHGMDLDSAADRLATEFARHRGRVFRHIKLNLLEAQLHQRKESYNAAHRCLRKSLQLAAPGRYIRCFLDEGDGILGMLREEYQSLLGTAGSEASPGPERPFVEQLLQASGTDLSRAPVGAAAPSLEALTDREKEILLFLANGVSNKEMAKRLFVSENTVKFHLKNIYAKLAVASRLQAITAARKLGLIPS